MDTGRDEPNRWSPTWGWDRPRPDGPVVRLSTQIAIFGLQIAVFGLFALGAAIARGEWDAGEAIFGFAGLLVGSAALGLWILRSYTDVQMLQEGMTAHLPDDASVLAARELLGRKAFWRAIGVLTAVFVAVFALQVATGSAMLMAATWLGASSGAVLVALIRQRLEGRDGTVLYTEADNWIGRRGKPRLFVGSREASSAGSA